jgi:isochorismate hydrolase
MNRKSMAAEPYELELDPASTALLIIDMQRDFVMPGGVR